MVGDLVFEYMSNGYKYLFIGENKLQKVTLKNNDISGG